MSLNSSPIVELGHWCLQSWWSLALLQYEEEVSMATLRAAPTWHHHTETLQWNNYRPTTYLAHPQERGRDGKIPSTKWQQTASQCNNTLLRTACK